MEGEIDEIDFSDGKKRFLDANRGKFIFFFIWYFYFRVFL